MLASLNHPNIAAIYGLEEADGIRALVLELVEGETLAERLTRGPVPVTDALTIARQIADALGAAHEKRIVHRDLKPANVKIRPDGAVKVLDFGLAKAGGDDPTPDSQVSTMAGTRAGIILGTMAYMSPEQARGQSVDKRTDIWAFGSVLFEMLTGRTAFARDTASDTIAGILEREPDWTALPGSSSARIRDLLRRCLQKDPSQRLHDIADARIDIEGEGDPTDRQPSIAVLPFANMSADPENEYFSDGLAEEVINLLAHIPGLKVIARTSAFAFKDKHEDIRRIAGVLDVTNILQGSVRKAGNRIRVTAQLIAAGDGSHLWSDRYDRELADVFAIQDEIAEAIAKALQVTLADKPAAPLSMMYVAGVQPAHEAVPLARVHAQKALELDPSLLEAHALLGLLAAMYDYDWTEADRRFRLAFARDPVPPLFVRIERANFFLAHVGRGREAVEEMERALAEDPLNVPETT